MPEPEPPRPAAEASNGEDQPSTSLDISEVPDEVAKEPRSKAQIQPIGRADSLMGSLVGIDLDNLPPGARTPSQQKMSLERVRKPFLQGDTPKHSNTGKLDSEPLGDAPNSQRSATEEPATETGSAAEPAKEATTSASKPLGTLEDPQSSFFRRLGQRSSTASTVAPMDISSPKRATFIGIGDQDSLNSRGSMQVLGEKRETQGSGRKLGDNRLSVGMATRASHKNDKLLTDADKESLMDLATREMSVIRAQGESQADIGDPGLHVPHSVEKDLEDPEDDSQTIPLLASSDGMSSEGIPAGGDDNTKSLRFPADLHSEPVVGHKRKNSKTTNGISVFDFKEDDTPEWRQRISKFVDAWPTTAFFVAITVAALFGDDIRLAVCPPAADPVFVALTYFMLAAFTTEMILFTIVKREYAFSFYFWLDLIATISLLFDIPAVNDAIISVGSSDTADSTTLARAGRTSRVGTKAGRIARVVRVIRLVRMLKIYKVLSAHLSKIGQKSRIRDAGKTDDDLDEEGNPRTAESRVGVKLTELTTRRVIVGVMLMLFLLPVFNIQGGYYGSPVLYEEEGLTMLHQVYLSSPESTEFEVAVKTYMDYVGYAMAFQLTGGVIELVVANKTQNVSDTLGMEDRRSEEVTSYAVTSFCGDDNEVVSEMADENCLESYVKIDNKWSSQFEAILNMCRTLFTCVILGVGALLFSRDANALVLHPLERMVQKVKEMSENPLAKMQIRAVATKDEQQMETRILENSITKICSLLAVGFGDAGAEVVAENIRNGGDLNPMVPGHRMMAIFGFCDIRRFTDATEVLQEEVMEFVNSIAKIVHMEVSLHGGSANKNIGDAFLLVWKLPAQLMSTADDLVLAASQLPADKRDSVAYLADRALAAFVVIHVALKRSPRLKQFCMRPDIIKRMGKGFRVSMGFGLHIGWAIEGAIGSEYKIDASYLSPNVNMASRLEAATKQFGCSILMSDDFAMMLSPKVRKLCRAIDVITVKGSNKPVTLYTYDISLSLVAEPDENQMHEDSMENLSHSFLSFKSEFEENPDITQTVGSSQEYRDQFQAGFQSYLDGRWAQAKDQLLQCLNRMDPSGSSVTDGPTASLLEVMGRSDFIAPNSWKGVRHLTDK